MTLKASSQRILGLLRLGRCERPPSIRSSGTHSWSCCATMLVRIRVTVSDTAIYKQQTGLGFSEAPPAVSSQSRSTGGS